MYPHQLIGKLAVRTKPVDYGERDSFFGGTKTKIEDYSFSSSPIKIMGATENHIIYKYVKSEEKLFGEEIRLLDHRWIDNNWTNYEELLELANVNNVMLS